jgi:hypothetical protein
VSGLNSSEARYKYVVAASTVLTMGVGAADHGAGLVERVTAAICADPGG